MDAWIDCMTSLDKPEDGTSTLHCASGSILTLELNNASDFDWFRTLSVHGYTSESIEALDVLGWACSHILLKAPTVKKVAIASLGVIVIAFGWLFSAMDYSDHIVVGTYVIASGGQTCILTLKADHSFHQERTQMGKTLAADGVWRRIGEGGLAFSKQFLIMPGQEPGPDGTSYGSVHKTLGLFPSIVLAQYQVLWYGRTDPGKGTEIVGSYAGDEPNISTQLTLAADHTFRQSWSKDSSAKEAQGTWEIIKNGDVKFSRDFLKTSGEPLNEWESASAWNPKGSNLQIVVAVNPSFAKPVFRRKLFWLR